MLIRFIAARTVSGARSQRPGVIEPNPIGAPSSATGADASLVSKSAAENQERQSESVVMHDVLRSSSPRGEGAGGGGRLYEAASGA